MPYFVQTFGGSARGPFDTIEDATAAVTHPYAVSGEYKIFRADAEPVRIVDVAEPVVSFTTTDAA